MTYKSLRQIDEFDGMEEVAYEKGLLFRKHIKG